MLPVMEQHVSTERNYNDPSSSGCILGGGGKRLPIHNFVPIMVQKSSKYPQCFGLHMIGTILYQKWYKKAANIRNALAYTLLVQFCTKNGTKKQQISATLWLTHDWYNFVPIMVQKSSKYPQRFGLHIIGTILYQKWYKKAAFIRISFSINCLLLRVTVRNHEPIHPAKRTGKLPEKPPERNFRK